LEREKAGDLLPAQRAAVKITHDILTCRQLCSVFHFTEVRLSQIGVHISADGGYGYQHGSADQRELAHASSAAIATPRRCRHDAKTFAGPYTEVRLCPKDGEPQFAKLLKLP
jgi:hypothetical protein